jgi:D-hydroxyproline dehydrogenase subunit beta
MNSKATDVIVVGAGIVGAACAYQLSRDKLSVRIFDDPVGAVTTAAGMGHLVAMDDSEQQLILTHYSQLLWQALVEEFPAAFSFERTGTIWVAANEQEFQDVQRKQAFYADHGIASSVLTAAELANAEPHLRPGLAGGLLVPCDSVVYPPEVASFLLCKAREFGAAFLGARVSSIGNGSVHLSDGSAFHAQVIINAAGPTATKLTPGLDLLLRKGHLVITDRYPGTVHHQVVELGYLKSAHTFADDSVAFNVQPRSTGQILIGSSRQTGVGDGRVDSPMVARMLRRAFEFMPILSRLSVIRVWTGVRVATPDKIPLIGPWEKDSTVYLAVGHEGLGITTSLVTARLISDLLLGRNPAIPVEPYLPSRPSKAGVLV